MREFTALGLQEKLLAAGIENRESGFYNRFGQLIYRSRAAKPPVTNIQKSASIAAGCK